MTRWIPAALFVVFAGFWSALDLVAGLHLALLPSALVGGALIAGLLRGEGGR